MEEKKRSIDPAVQQIIDRILAQHFGNDPTRRKTIGEMDDEIMAAIMRKIQFI